MRIVTAISTNPDGLGALRDIAAQIGRDLGKVPPDFIALHFAEGLAEAFGTHAADLLPSGALHGGTSCLGVMSQNGAAISAGAGSGAFAIFDPEGSYGSGHARLCNDPHAAARQATLDALRRAGRSGESPALVWLTAAPGCEEGVLAGIQDIVGVGTPIVGGSSADNAVAGNWRQMCNGALLEGSVVVSVLFPSGAVSTALQGGYAPTGASGLVTKASGRKLISIDNRSAAQVYAEWTEGDVPFSPPMPQSILPQSILPRSILAAATLRPLGRVADHIAGVPFHVLMHPATSHPDGSLDLFADIAIGDRLWQMEGTADSLTDRAAGVARAALALGSSPAGALVVYCAGCLLAQPDRLPEVAARLNAALSGAPFLGVFTFGEQGIVPPDQSRHGNLMISCTVFSHPEEGPA